MSTTTVEFTLLNHRRAALNAIAAAEANSNPARAQQAERALRRIEAGLYGYCVRCGIKIPEAQLERRPERDGCPDCEP
jgi:DnaK suppressor protein